MRLRRCLIIAITYIAICTSCRKKHSGRLSALGIQISDKGRRDQTAAAAGKDSQRFVELTVVFLLCHAFRLEHFHHMPFSRAINARGRGGSE